MVEASIFFVQKQVASFEKNLRYFFLQEWNGTDIKILIYIYIHIYFFFFGGGGWSYLLFGGFPNTSAIK